MPPYNEPQMTGPACCRFCTTLKTRTVLCFECLEDFFLDCWDALVDFLTCLPSWFQDTLCGSSQAVRPQEATIQRPQNVNCKTIKIPISSPSKPVETTGSAVTSNLPSVDRNQPNDVEQRPNAASKLPAITSEKTTSAQQIDQIESSKDFLSAEQQTITRVEPPRLEFVETGSIFGDRRRANDANLLLLENGRFKSPGKPRVLQGPGGRTIRVSFQTGFQNIKSVDSRSSLKDVAVLKSTNK